MERLKLLKKVQKEHSSFADSVEGLSVEDLKKNFDLYGKNKQEVKEAKEKRETMDDIKELKETIKNELAPFNESLNIYSLKLDYLSMLIKDKGGVLVEK